MSGWWVAVSGVGLLIGVVAIAHVGALLLPWPYGLLGIPLGFAVGMVWGVVILAPWALRIDP